MYDTVHLWLECRDTEHLPARLDTVKEHCTVGTGELHITGNAGNMRVLISNHRVAIKGSLAKYYLGDNIGTLTRLDARNAIEKLSDTLGLPAEQAHVSRVDMGACLTVDRPISRYLAALGEAPRLRRSENNMGNGQGLYYTNQQRQLAFYDKLQELRGKRQPLPGSIGNRSLLRYELRFMKRVRQQFGMAQLTGKSLYDEWFFLEAVRRWEKQYFSIHRCITPKVAESALAMGVRAFTELLALHGLQSLGGERFLLASILEARRNGHLDKMQCARLRLKLRQLQECPDLITTNDALLELDNEIREIAEGLRQIAHQPGE